MGGAKVIDRLSHDLKKDFPDMTGLSPPRNLKYMRRFSESWPNREIVQRTVAQIPWGGSNIALLDKLKDPEVRIWYAQKTLEYGWSRDILTIQIENRLHERQGKALNNFDTAFRLLIRIWLLRCLKIHTSSIFLELLTHERNGRLSRPGGSCSEFSS